MKVILLLAVFTPIVTNALSKSPPKKFRDPRDSFSDYSLANPVIISTAKGKRSVQSDTTHHEDNLLLAFEAFSKDFSLNLHMNQALLPENYFEEYEENGEKVIRYPMKENGKQHCYYQGHLQNTSNSWAAVSICDGVRGVIHDGKQFYYIEPDHISDSKAHFVFKASDFKQQNKHCGTDSDVNFIAGNLSAIENNEILINSQDQIANLNDPRYIEMIYIADTAEATKLRNERKNPADKMKEIANIVNGLYAPLNIFVALIGVIIWSRDESDILSDSQATLDNFMQYKHDVLRPRHPHDSVMLVTGIEFDDGVVGKAYIAQMCNKERSGGVIMDHDPNIGIVASTSAHETGHTLGMPHDGSSCHCADENGCIMKPTSSSHALLKWSSCSPKHVAKFYKDGYFYCMKNKPKTNELQGCGNRFVDPGEECDCGPKEFCINPCCDADTCRLTRNSACAFGPCCDLQTCQVKQQNTVCREAVSECDIAEYCDGASGSCPADRFNRNGNECRGGEAYCYNGKCNTHDSQCKLIFGDAAKGSNPVCFDRNVNGTEDGNCGSDKRTNTYKACGTQNVLCGLLKCDYDRSNVKFGEDAVKFLKAEYVLVDRSWAMCRSVTFDFGEGMPDLGMTLDGTKCGDRKICVNQRCVPTSSVRG